MHRLEHRWKPPRRIDVPACRSAHAARYDGCDVRKDVSEQVAGYHHVERFRTAHEVHARRVHEQRLRLHPWVLCRHSLERLVPDYQSVALCVRLCDRGYPPLAIPRECCFEGVSDHALAPAPREDARLDADFIGEPTILKAPDVCVFPFGVLPNHYHVDIPSRLVPQRRRDAPMQHARTLADVLIELPPDRQQETVQGNVVLQVRMPYRAEVDLIEFR